MQNVALLTPLQLLKRSSFRSIQETGFFRSWGGSWDTDYGRFFLGWYSSALEKHGDRLLAAAAQIFRPNRPPVSAGFR